METIECKNCGSSALELVGNEYVCQACGSRFQASELSSTPQSESTVQLSEDQKAELKRLKANLKDDHSLSKRILELDPYDWEAYYYAHGTDDKWLDCLKQSGLPVRDIESALSTYYYEDQKRSAIERHLEKIKKWGNSLSFRDDYMKEALTVLLDFKKTLHSKGIHIKSILGEEYSSLIQKWEADWEISCAKYTNEITNLLESDRKQQEYRLKEKKRHAHKVILGMIMVVLGIILGFCSVDLSWDSSPVLVVGLIIGAILLFVAGIWISGSHFEKAL